MFFVRINLTYDLNDICCSFNQSECVVSVVIVRKPLIARV